MRRTHKHKTRSSSLSKWKGRRDHKTPPFSLPVTNRGNWETGKVVKGKGKSIDHSIPSLRVPSCPFLLRSPARTATAAVCCLTDRSSSSSFCSIDTQKTQKTQKENFKLQIWRFSHSRFPFSFLVFASQLSFPFFLFPFSFFCFENSRLKSRRALSFLLPFTRTHAPKTGNSTFVSIVFGATKADTNFRGFKSFGDPKNLSVPFDLQRALTSF